MSKRAILQFVSLLTLLALFVALPYGREIHNVFLEAEPRYPLLSEDSTLIEKSGSHLSVFNFSKHYGGEPIPFEQVKAAAEEKTTKFFGFFLFLTIAFFWLSLCFRNDEEIMYYEAKKRNLLLIDEDASVVLKKHFKTIQNKEKETKC